MRSMACGIFAVSEPECLQMLDATVESWMNLDTHLVCHLALVEASIRNAYFLAISFIIEYFIWSDLFNATDAVKLRKGFEFVLVNSKPDSHWRNGKLCDVHSGLLGYLRSKLLSSDIGSLVENTVDSIECSVHFSLYHVLE
ncbi:hypothetical protein HG531_012344 [Fusarium graminearum]|nr:hypothetical protein HG531_012344 [Fusarium graminearum]